MPDTTVKFFRSIMSGAPVLSGTAGALIAVLDACLVTGFGSVTLDSLVVSGNVATGTKSAGHGFEMSGRTGAVIRIAGATPSGLNGDWRIASVPDSTTFTFATSGISDQTASGTITAKRAPAGFNKAFSGTNKAAYRSDDVMGTQLYLRVEDSTTTYATVRGYETMSDVDTGTGLFNDPWYWRKSHVSDSGGRWWEIVADSRYFYLFSYWGSPNGKEEGYGFGDIVSRIAAGDPYGCALIAAVVNNSAYPGGNSPGYTEFYKINESAVGHVLARGYSQIGGSVSFSKLTHASCGTILGGTNNGYVYPDPINNEFLASTVQVKEGAVIRGDLPGLYAPLHYRTPTGYTIIQGATRDLAVFALGRGDSDYGRCAVDITGPWS